MLCWKFRLQSRKHSRSDLPFVEKLMYMLIDHRLKTFDIDYNDRPRTDPTLRPTQFTVHSPNPTTPCPLDLTWN